MACRILPPRALRSESLSKGETSKTDVPSANVAKFGPVAIRERARSASFALNEPAVRAMIGARDRLIVDGNAKNVFVHRCFV